MCDLSELLNPELGRWVAEPAPEDGTSMAAYLRAKEAEGPTAEELDRSPVGSEFQDTFNQTWRHLRESGSPWEDPTPAWEIVDPGDPEIDYWAIRPQSNTLSLRLGYGPFRQVK